MTRPLHSVPGHPGNCLHTVKHSTRSAFDDQIGLLHPPHPKSQEERGQEDQVEQARRDQTAQGDNRHRAQDLETGNVTQEQHREKLASDAVDRIQSTLALRELARVENLQATPEEIDTEFNTITSGSEITEDQLAKLKADSQRRNQIANIIVKRKLKDLLFSKAKIKDVPAGEKA